MYDRSELLTLAAKRSDIKEMCKSLGSKAAVGATRDCYGTRDIVAGPVYATMAESAREDGQCEYGCQAGGCTSK